MEFRRFLEVDGFGLLLCLVFDFFGGPVRLVGWVVLVGFGWFWLVLVGFGWFWLVLVGFGWFWLVLVGWLVGWLFVLPPINEQNTYMYAQVKCVNRFPFQASTWSVLS